eukprot:tig00020560_g11091.t1
MGGWTLDVPLPTPLSAYTSSILVRELIKYLLFMRQQIPCTYDEFKRCLQQDCGEGGIPGKSGPRASLQLRRRLKLVHSAESLFQSVEAAFATNTCISSVMISMGSSPVSPRELYVIKFANEWSLRGQHGAVDTSALGVQGFGLERRPPEPAELERAREVCRRMIRALVVADLDVFHRDLGATKLAVLFLSPATACSPDLFPRQNFSVATTRRRLTPVEIRLGSFPAVPPSSSAPPSMSASRALRPPAVQRRTVVLRAGLDDGEDVDRTLGNVVASFQLHEPGSSHAASPAAPAGDSAAAVSADCAGGGVSETWFQCTSTIQGLPGIRPEQ